MLKIIIILHNNLRSTNYLGIVDYNKTKYLDRVMTKAHLWQQKR